MDRRYTPLKQEGQNRAAQTAKPRNDRKNIFPGSVKNFYETKVQHLTLIMAITVSVNNNVTAHPQNSLSTDTPLSLLPCSGGDPEWVKLSLTDNGKMGNFHPIYVVKIRFKVVDSLYSQTSCNPLHFLRTLGDPRCTSLYCVAHGPQDGGAREQGVMTSRE